MFLLSPAYLNRIARLVRPPVEADISLTRTHEPCVPTLNIKALTLKAIAE